jgi:hypothetical protein
MQFETALPHLWGIAFGRIGIEKLAIAFVADIILLPFSVTVFAYVHRLTIKTLHLSIGQSFTSIHPS